MEITPFNLYLIFQADTIRIAAIVCLCVLAIATPLGSLIISEFAPGPEKLSRFLKQCIAAIVILIVVLSIIPTTKTLVAIFGIPMAIDGAKKVAETDLAKKGAKAVEKLLDEYLSEKK